MAAVQTLAATMQTTPGISPPASKGYCTLLTIIKLTIHPQSEFVTFICFSVRTTVIFLHIISLLICVTDLVCYLNDKNLIFRHSLRVPVSLGQRSVLIQCVGCMWSRY
jgi:hypothetical protein